MITSIKRIIKRWLSRAGDDPKHIDMYPDVEETDLDLARLQQRLRLIQAHERLWRRES